MMPGVQSGVNAQADLVGETKAEKMTALWSRADIFQEAAGSGLGPSRLLGGRRVDAGYLVHCGPVSGTAVAAGPDPFRYAVYLLDAQIGIENRRRLIALRHPQPRRSAAPMAQTLTSHCCALPPGAPWQWDLQPPWV